MTDPTLWDAIPVVVDPQCPPDTVYVMRADQWDEAEAAIAQVEENARPEWLDAAETYIRSMTPGTRFIGENVTDAMQAAGWDTHDLRAMGPIVQKLARAGVIFRTGQYRAARTSHGSPKPVWEKR